MERVRTWYLLVAAFMYVGAVAGVMLAPVLPMGTPHKTTPNAVAAVAASVARAVGVPGTPVVVLASSRHSNAMSAHAAGIGPTSRALLGDVTLVHMTPPELRVALAHAFAHVRSNDTLRQTLMAVTLFVFSAAIAVLLSDRVGFRRDDDALSRLALVATFLGLVLLFAYPVYNGVRAQPGVPGGPASRSRRPAIARRPCARWCATPTTIWSRCATAARSAGTSTTVRRWAGASRRPPAPPTRVPGGGPATAAPPAAR